MKNVVTLFQLTQYKERLFPDTHGTKAKDNNFNTCLYSTKLHA